MRIVVTGASGFIGGFLVRSLQNGRDEVLGVARSASQDPSRVRVGSYQESPGGDVLVHLAENGDRTAALSAGDAYESDALRTLKGLIAKGFRRVVYVSSAVVYGDESSLPHRTDSPVHAIDPYTRSKLACEAFVLDAGGVAARLSNVYGPGMSPRNVVSRIIGQIPGTGPLQIWDDKPVRDFIWVEDVAFALAAMVSSTACGVFNVGTGVGTRIGALAQLALALAGEEGRRVVAIKPSGRLSSCTLDIGETADRIGWAPRTPLNEGMRLLLAQRDKEETDA